MSDFIGVIFPIPQQFIERFFIDKKNVFVKFLTGESTSLKEGQIFLFYASYGTKKIVGEGIIKNIEFLKASQVYRKYPNKLFLEKDELFEYVGYRTFKKMLTIELSNIMKYEESLITPIPITIAGLLITKKQYEQDFKNIKKMRIT